MLRRLSTSKRRAFLNFNHDVSFGLCCNVSQYFKRQFLLFQIYRSHGYSHCRAGNVIIRIADSIGERHLSQMTLLRRIFNLLACDLCRTILWFHFNRKFNGLIPEPMVIRKDVDDHRMVYGCHRIIIESFGNVILGFHDNPHLGRIGAVFPITCLIGETIYSIEIWMRFVGKSTLFVQLELTIFRLTSQNCFQRIGVRICVIRQHTRRLDLDDSIFLKALGIIFSNWRDVFF
jgi:hypothetical protein